MPNWNEIRQEWETTKITLTKLADKHDVKLGTLKSRKSRESWSRDATSKKYATISKNMQPKKGAPKGNKNAVGNKGNPNPKPKFAERNTKAVKHGLFSRYIPKETLEIMGMLDKSDPADLIWDQIQIQYAAIIRAQQIMFVSDKNDHEEFITKEKSDDFGEEKQWEHHTAWDRHAVFLNAQSRAMSELRSSIKQFNDMANEYDERRLNIEQMQVNIEKTKVEITRLSGETMDEYEDDGFIEALGDAVEVWNNDSDGSTEET